MFVCFFLLFASFCVVLHRHALTNLGIEFASVEVYQHKKNSTRSMGNFPTKGPCFGNGDDIVIADNCYTNQYSGGSQGGTYDYHGTRHCNIGMHPYFTVKNYEVWGVKENKLE